MGWLTSRKSNNSDIEEADRQANIPVKLIPLAMTYPTSQCIYSISNLQPEQDINLHYLLNNFTPIQINYANDIDLRIDINSDLPPKFEVITAYMHKRQLSGYFIAVY